MQSPEIVPLVSVAELERVASALRALPQVAPEHSTWAGIESLLATAPARGTSASARAPARWITFAAAASLAVASAWLGVAQWNRIRQPAIEGKSMTAQSAATGVGDSPGELSAQAALIERSASLERWLVESGSAQWPQDIGSASASVEIENLIANVDQRLTRSGNNAERGQLWQRRVGLLEQLVTLQGEPLALSLPNASVAMVL